LPPCSTPPKLIRPLNGAAAGGGKGSSPVLVGLMYDISVEEEPSPGASCGMSAWVSFRFDDDARLDGRGGSAGGMVGSDVAVFKDLLVSTGLWGNLPGEIEPEVVLGEDEDWSIVTDFRIGVGFGEIGGDAGPALVDGAGCQRSRTDDFLGPARGVPPNSFALASSCELVLIMFCTNPRPLSLLKLGVGSFSACGRRNARDGFCVVGICGPVGDCRGTGWMGRASEGVVTCEAFLGDEDTGEVEGPDGRGVCGREETGGEEEGVLTALVGVFVRKSGMEDCVTGRRP
jgi:hypothetical protein